MKKWLAIMGLAVAVVGTLGISSQVAAQPDEAPSEAEYYARVDARLQEVMRSLLTARRSDAHTVAVSR
jgi:hypothetical protein